MMSHLTCPQCSTRIPASNINVQDKIAVCPACDTVFKFNSADAEPADAVRMKRRKVKQPSNLSLREDDERLEIAFRTNFRLDQDRVFIENGMTVIGFTVVTLLFLLGAEALGTLFLIPLSAALFMLYRLGLRLFNRTHIEADNTAIRVSRKPLPNPLGQEYTIGLADAESIRCEETEASKLKKYDTPRYRIFAEMVDGHEKLIVNDVVEDYGYFIAHQLQSYVDQQHDVTDNLLGDDVDEADGQFTMPEQQLTDRSARLSTRTTSGG